MKKGARYSTFWHLIAFIALELRQGESAAGGSVSEDDEANQALKWMMRELEMLQDLLDHR